MTKATDIYLNSIDMEIIKLSDADRSRLIQEFSEYERTGVSGDTLLRQTATAIYRGLQRRDTGFDALYMTLVGSAAHKVENYRSLEMAASLEDSTQPNVAANYAGPGNGAPFAEELFDLRTLHEILLEGNFYADYDESSRLMGVLRKHVEALPDVFHIINELTIEQSWEERKRAEAIKEGITDEDALADIMFDAEGDEDDDYLLERDTSLKDLTEMAREVAARLGSLQPSIAPETDSPSL